MRNGLREVAYEYGAHRYPQAARAVAASIAEHGEPVLRRQRDGTYTAVTPEWSRATPGVTGATGSAVPLEAGAGAPTAAGAPASQTSPSWQEWPQPLIVPPR